MELYIKDLFNGEDFKVYDEVSKLNFDRTIFKINNDCKIKKITIDKFILKFNPNDKVILFNLLDYEDLKHAAITIEYKRDFETVVQHIEVFAEEDTIGIKNNFLEKLNQFSSSYDMLYDEEFLNIEWLKYIYNEVFKIYGTASIKDEPYGIINKIYNLAVLVFKSPKCSLIEKNIITDVKNAKKITKDSIDYFCKNSDTWYKEEFMNPRPVKVLSESYTENTDIYENRLVVYILWMCKNICKRRLESMESKEQSLEGEELHLERDSETGIKNNEINAESINKQREEIGDLLSKYEKIINSIDQLIKKLKGVKLDKNIRIKMTQKILYDKRYLSIYKLYQKIGELYKNKLISMTSEKLYKNYHYDYMFMLIYTLTCLFKELQISPIENIDGVNRSEKDDNYIFRTSDCIKIVCGFNNTDSRYHEKVRVIINAYSFSHESAKLQGKIVIEFINHENKKKTRIVLHPYIMSVNNVDSSSIEKVKELYKKIDISKDHEYILSSEYIVHNVSVLSLSYLFKEVLDRSEPQSEEDVKNIYNLVFYLSNTGNNFLKEEDYKNYGEFKVGMIPVTFENYPYLYNKVLNLMRMHLVKIGVVNRCLYCGEERIETLEGGYQCSNSNCRRRWFINQCSHCGYKIVKFLPIKPKKPQEKDDSKPFHYHQAYEVKSSFIGACYRSDKFYDNSGGICPSCGKCSKESSNNKYGCIRCKLKDT